MCGRFSLTVDPATARPKLFTVDSRKERFQPRYNVAPSQEVLAVAGTGQGEWVLGSLRWGLIPFWADDAALGNRLINARAETVHERPSFRYSFHNRRCVVLADGFYEWQALPGKKTKQPYRFVLQGDKSPVFALAGLWDRWESPRGEVIHSCTIITTEANSVVAPVHHRMPVILKGEALAAWLNQTLPEPERLLPLLQPYRGRDLTAYAVSTLVNHPRNDSPEVIDPLPKSGE